MSTKIWVEAYRPKTVDDVILPESIKKHFYAFRKNGSVPNLLLSGPPGTGKTTVARALLEGMGYDYIVINGSDSAESGIDSLRTHIRTFASSVSLEGKKKFVIVDESDYLSQATQPALRQFIEKFSSNAGFIFTANYPNRIIDPLRSRLSHVEFNVSKDERPDVFKQFHKRVCSILDREGITYDKKLIAEFIVKLFPDFRRVINELQRYSAGGEIDNTILSNVGDDAVNELFESLKQKNFKQMRTWVSEHIDLGSADIFRKMYEKLADYLTPQSVPQIVIILADYQYRDYFAVDKEINMVAALAEIAAEAMWK